MMKLVLLSGGVDSSTALALAKATDTDILAITFTYNQQHEQMELLAAQKVSEYYQVNHKIMDLSSIFSDSQSALSLNNDIPIAEGAYGESNELNTEVEFRNGVFLAILASLAKQYRADEIYFGAHQDESGTVYPDCSPEFIQTMNQAIQLGTNNSVSIKAPFMTRLKKDIVATGIELEVPYELTYSCYKGTDPACGVCGTCIDRKKAFEANGLEVA